LAQGALILVGREAVRPPTRDRMAFVEDARHEAGHPFLASGSIDLR
jgi:hypothetical protein